MQRAFLPSNLANMLARVEADGVHATRTAPDLLPGTARTRKHFVVVLDFSTFLFKADRLLWVNREVLRPRRRSNTERARRRGVDLEMPYRAIMRVGVSDAIPWQSKNKPTFVVVFALVPEWLDQRASSDSESRGPPAADAIALWSWAEDSGINEGLPWPARVGKSIEVSVGNFRFNFFIMSFFLIL